MFCRYNFHKFFKEDLNNFFFFSFFFNYTLGSQSQKSLASIWHIQLLYEKDQVDKKLNKIRIWNTKERKAMKKNSHTLTTKNL